MNSLAPEHLVDLRRSGLSDTTISVLQVKSVRPADIKIHGVVSAYALPYFSLDGSVNCFSRRKVFPPIKTNHGTMKYHQPPDSPPNLYLPPIVRWIAIANDPTALVTLTEGEKKAAAGCQEGLAVMGVAGVWCWRSTLDNGDKLVLPMLDEFRWSTRPVLLCPDSDAWHDGKEMAILAGFFALAKELQHRGAMVQFVKLPDLHGRKCGLDDWLCVSGNNIEHGWPKLERIALTDDRFSSLTSWWQGWKEKQATVTHLNAQPVEVLDVHEVAGLYTITFPVHHVRFRFERLGDARGGVQAELTITTGETKLLGSTDISLKSDPSRAKIASSLKGLAAAIPWKRLIERACDVVLQRHRAGEPVIALAPSTSIHVPFVVNPLVYRDHQTLVFAPGGSCKSYLALVVALQACHGSAFAGLSAIKVPVLYLDWELNAETVGGRLKALQAGHPELSHYVPFYRRCEAPLLQEVHQIASHVAERGVKLVIVDSAAMACGGDLASPDAAIKLQRALRMIGCASLVLAHTSKTVQDGQEKTAYGTVFFRELARNVWELQRADGDHPVRVALHQKKNNFGAAHPALGFEFTFSPEAVQISACNPADEPEFEDRLPIPARIRNLLEDGTARTAREIADDLTVKLVTIKSALSRGKGHKWQQLDGDYQTPKWTVLRPK